MLVFRPLLFLEHESILGLNIGDFIIEPHEVMLKVLELKKLSLESGDHMILMIGFSLFIAKLTLVVP